ncbi:DUF1254 domain-containing protein [Flavobacterium sp. MR2016-29]|uniref:DUF1254 domain-containing protein n=1 Tax=Flavobacterium sp. MR2016-29 TaxID=2783795 RepID=UPI00188A5A6B|nr:DUF1254 domain-containing protein [Flavobacterium sp. MR2016-29]MBF4491564.1 DUF1254 domain-containing protein [Flavobacterium sp. MR2016-29]
MKKLFLLRTLLVLVSFVVLSSCKKEIKQEQNKQADLTTEQAKSLAKDAYLFGLPVVFFEKQVDFQSYTTKVTDKRAPINQFFHYRAFVEASDRSVVGFNVDNLYSIADLDLSKEPLVLFVPQMGNRFWLMQVIDAWNGVPAAPGSRTYGGKGGTFLITGPDYKGDIPKDMEVIKCPTNLAVIGGRTYCAGKSDYATVNKLQDQYKLVPLSQWGKNYIPPANVPLKEGVDGTTLVNKQFASLTAEQFYKNLNRLMANNPPYASDSVMVKKIEKLGIKPGADFSLSTFKPDIAKAIEEGYKEGFEAMMKESAQLGKIVNGWSLTYDMGKYGTRYTYRAAWTYFGIGGNILEDAFYPLAQTDADKNPLDSSNKYTLTFAKNQIPPASAFWSLTMYDFDAYLVPNPLKRYALGDRSNLKFEKDGSLTIYMQNTTPGKDKESNWLPTPNSGKFKVALRLYVPKPEVTSGKWLPPAIQKVK